MDIHEEGLFDVLSSEATKVYFVEADKEGEKKGEAG